MRLGLGFISPVLLAATLVFAEAAASDSSAAVSGASETAASPDAEQASASVASGEESSSAVEEFGETDSSAPAATAPSIGNKIGGEISGFLKASNSPYIVEETLVLNDGKALLIEAGVVLEFKEGTGIDVRGGSFAIVGEPDNKVVLKPAAGSSLWNGISITGNRRAVFQNVEIRNAEVGVSIENGLADFATVYFERCSKIALYSRSSVIDVQWSEFRFNSGVAFWAGANTFGSIESSRMYNNNVAVITSPTSVLNLQTTMITRNEFGVVNMEPSRINQLHSQIEQNTVGLVSNDLPSAEVRSIAKNNQQDFSQNLKSALFNVADEPSNPVARNYNVQSYGRRGADGESWRVEGNTGIAVGYHGVIMNKNTTDEDYVVGDDTVKVGDEYTNYFQIPGLFANWNAYLLMESPTGKTLEFSTDIGSDTWNHFKVNNILAVYSDKHQRFALGDVFLSAGETYLAGVNLLGASYDLNLFKNRVDEPLFVVSGFVGESQKPKLIGDRNEDVYKDYVEDGEIEPQEIVAGGKVRWNMHRRFNGTLGFIGGKDYVDDPFIRDGNSSSLNTASPVMTSRTFFADGNWLVFPGDIELNGQVAVGAADTTNAQMQRAINNVFANAGVDASNFAALRKLMANPKLVNQMEKAELEEFFGDNSLKTTSEMRSELTRLLELAQNAYDKYKDEEDSPSEMGNWGRENFAFMGSLRWDLGKTVISGHLRYVGANYYSAGSPDLLQNSREAFGNLDQKIFDFWKLNFSYRINVENAAHGGAYNFCGLAEGAKLGLVPGADDEWLEEHEQDENRTLYEHNAALDNSFKINSKLDVAVGYALNYRTRGTKQRLYGDFSGLSGIYEDPWFDSRKGESTIDLFVGDDTLKVDSARWAQYYALADEPYLATQFTEKFLRQTVSLNFKLSLPKNVLKVGGEWTFRSDLSEFEQDDLISDFDFKDETYGLLGYYFHGADYFEQRYPVSLTTSTEKFRNMFSVVPRYKIYNRDEMTDFEWSVSDNFSMPLVKNYMDLMVSANFRQEFLKRDEGEKTLEESESDFSASTTLKVNHTDRLTTEWTLGTYCNFRPDYESDEYKDIFGIVSLNYAF